MAKRARKKSSPRVRILPRKISTLIKLAEADLTKAENTKGYLVVMNQWLTAEKVECRTSMGVLVESHNVCSVCYAGAVMAFSLKAVKDLEFSEDNTELGPDAFDGNSDQLQALDDLRRGDVTVAARTLDLISEGSWAAYQQTFGEFNSNIPEYDRDNPKPFHKAMQALQKKLEKAGY